MALRGSIVAALIFSASLLPLLASCAPKAQPPDSASSDSKDHSDHADHGTMGGGGGYSAN
jgi:hypothetical protein